MHKMFVPDRFFADFNKQAKIEQKSSKNRAKIAQEQRFCPVEHFNSDAIADDTAGFC